MANKPERSVEEIVAEFTEIYPARYNGSYFRLIPRNIDDMTEWLTQTLTAERQKREEMVEEVTRLEKWLKHCCENGGDGVLVCDIWSSVQKITQPNNK